MTRISDEKKYRCIVIDPPWPQSMTGTYATRRKRNKRLPYRSMTLDEIRNLDVMRYADAEHGCHIYLWTTNTFLRHSWDIMEGWGFRPMQILTWCKPSGIATWWISVTEFCLFGYVGKLRMKNRFQMTYFTAQSKRHSAKPQEFLDRYPHRVSFGPYLEIFARERRLDWDAIGDEVGVPIDV